MTTVCCVTPSTPNAAIVRESLALSLPTAVLTVAAPANVGATSLAFDCLVIDATSDGAAAGEMVRRLRAGGATAAIVLIVGARDEGFVAQLAPLGAIEHVEVTAVPRGLGPAVEAALGGMGWSGPLEEVQVELRKMQCLVAAGEIALGLQHAMNNPLTAVLAEAQLLEMEGLPPEQAPAVGRIIENTRRLAALVRKLDVIATRTGARHG